MDVVEIPMQLLILLREVAWSHGFAVRDTYPVIRQSDRKILALYVSGHGWFPYGD